MGVRETSSLVRSGCGGTRKANSRGLVLFTFGIKFSVLITTRSEKEKLRRGKRKGRVEETLKVVVEGVEGDKRLQFCALLSIHVIESDISVLSTENPSEKTELNGLKWKCLTTPISRRAWTSLEQDPILSAYAKCLQAGILCAWRRQPPQPSGTFAAMQLPDYRIDVIKELWVFWYSQEEPDCLAEYTSHLECRPFTLSQCAEDGQGNWSIPGIQYETRTLFFKALHNLIERYVNGISFNFFVHGENIVCATLSVQRQPTLFRLSRRHLDLSKKQPVILGPWSMRAVLLPEQPLIVDSTAQMRCQPFVPQCGSFSSTSAPYTGICREPLSSVAHEMNLVPCSSVNSSTVCSGQDNIGIISKIAVDKLWSEWLQFFCLIVNDERNLSSADTVGYVGYTENTSSVRSSMPKMVLVDVDGVHMWYPSSLIVVQASDDLLIRQSDENDNDEKAEFFNSSVINSSYNTRTPPASAGHTRLRSTPSFRRRKKRSSECEVGPGGEQHNVMYGTLVNGARAAQRFFEESFIAPTTNKRKESTESPPSSGLGFLMSAATSDDDCRYIKLTSSWNFTDGIRRRDREENCGCRQCQIRNSHLQHSVGIDDTSDLSSQCASLQQDACLTREPNQLAHTAVNFVSDGTTNLEERKKKTIMFHRRSSSFVRSPSPPRSPPWERKILATSLRTADGGRNLDWILESDYRCSMTVSRSGRSELLQVWRWIAFRHSGCICCTNLALRFVMLIVFTPPS
ncbi:unnamed protein product [Thelazia callipaeda]|uniref:Mediator of RNA polymerase II transcription subunit 13 n=1 Tax=Thelazia callipaeda TaxID=103827 RepID=A0A0N5DBP5_THECL|nr:unnamed protein product [Thelazia callipaeda]